MPIDTVAPGHKALNGRNNKKRNKRKEETNQQVTPPRQWNNGISSGIPTDL
jgi:hypothetical protein